MEQAEASDTVVIAGRLPQRVCGKRRRRHRVDDMAKRGWEAAPSVRSLPNNSGFSPECQPSVALDGPTRILPRRCFSHRRMDAVRESSDGRSLANCTYAEISERPSLELTNPGQRLSRSTRVRRL